MTDVKIFKSPDGKFSFATFNTRLNGDGRRAKHYVVPDRGRFVHIVHFLVPKDDVPAELIGQDASERVFFGKMRIVELFESHLSETWMAIGEIVKMFGNNLTL